MSITEEAPITAEAPVVGPTSSVADHLRATFVEAQQDREKDIAIPGYEELHVIFRPLTDYAQQRQAVSQSSRPGMSQATREIEVSIGDLIAASVSSYALVGGVRAEIGLPLGIGLYDFIFPSQDGERPEQRPGTDAEAVMLLFDNNTLRLMTIAGTIVQWSTGVSADTDEVLLGKF